MVRCLDLDRLAPTRRPEGPASGTQRWSELLFAHWSFPLELVRPLVPASLELDPWDGRAWVGLVPFKMEAIRSSWMPRRAGLDFLETNVRTYVHHRGEPGVFFFSLEASSWLAVRVARLGWGLPYFHAEMSSEREGSTLRYRSRRKAQDAALHAEWELGDVLGPQAPGTLDHFLLERYLLFNERGGRVHKGHVHHVPYPAQRARTTRLEQTLLGAAGLPDPSTAPEALHYAAGVDVEVFGPWPVDDP
jgi:uncharacterized protein